MKSKKFLSLLLSACCLSGCRVHIEFLSKEKFDSLFQIDTNRDFFVYYNYFKERHISKNYPSAIFREIENNKISQYFPFYEYEFTSSDLIQVSRSELVHFLREYLQEQSIYEDNYYEVLKNHFPHSYIEDELYNNYVSIINYHEDYTVQCKSIELNSIISKATKYSYSNDDLAYISYTYNDFNAKSLKPARNIDECFKHREKNQYKYDKKTQSYRLKKGYQDVLDNGQPIEITESFFTLYESVEDFTFFSTGTQKIDGETYKITTSVMTNYRPSLVTDFSKKTVKNIECEHEYSIDMIQDKSNIDGCFYHFYKCSKCGDCKMIAKCVFEDGHCIECGHLDH